MRKIKKTIQGICVVVTIACGALAACAADVTESGGWWIILGLIAGAILFGWLAWLLDKK